MVWVCNDINWCESNWVNTTGNRSLTVSVCQEASFGQFHFRRKKKWFSSKWSNSESTIIITIISMKNQYLPDLWMHCEFFEMKLLECLPLQGEKMNKSRDIHRFGWTARRRFSEDVYRRNVKYSLKNTHWRNWSSCPLPLCNFRPGRNVRWWMTIDNSRIISFGTKNIVKCDSPDGCDCGIVMKLTQIISKNESTNKQ